MTRLSAFIESVGLLGPGLRDWPQAAQVLAGHAALAPERTVLPPPSGLPTRIETDADSVARDLFRLVLTLVEFIRQLMERQAVRRMDELDDEQVEALGSALMRLEDAMTQLRESQGLTRDDLDIDLGPLGHLLG